MQITVVLNNILNQQELTVNTEACQTRTLKLVHRICDLEHIIIERKEQSELALCCSLSPG
jgi:hypothetical protein